MEIEIVCRLPHETEDTFVTLQGEAGAVERLLYLLQIKTKVLKVNKRPDILKKEIRGDWLG